MKTLLLLILAVGLVYWLSHNTIILPGVGLIQLSWPAAVVCVAVFYMIFVLLPWLLRSET